MAHFANGFEADRFQARFCDHCQHGPADGCAVWDAHQDFQPDGRTDAAGAAAQEVLDALIVPGAGAGLPECALFLPLSPDQEGERQTGTLIDSRA